MHSTKTLLLLVLLLLGFVPQTLRAQAPEPPLPVEMMFSPQQLYFQMVVKKSFAPHSRFGFFSVATYTTGYTSDSPDLRIIIPVQFSYAFGKGFGLMAGTDINTHAGFAPIVGPQHSYASRKILAVTVVSYTLNASHDLKLFGLYEYKPALAPQWSLYTRLQFFYNHTLQENAHNRSYLYLRAGLKRGPCIVGIGANLDRFGPHKAFQDHYGPFLRWEF
ncbi:hypothetical protein SAMN05421823_11158 [Catalinimonas alkaloidigena]|uniref:Uncharacterized protein n=1 Tax=Catalinimonas alkaloidigena TaxID=1075417 RepID=A0A1G9R855_9BACT|nr:hypothetical protein [Catalinimonas alkaloidigena]SDM19007.1 hypothetical protein SAMN05421823_11158 [Catalinimonas alkaloidigena]